MLLTDLMPEYLGALTVAGLSPRTIKNYRLTCQKFLAWAVARGLTSVSDFTCPVICTWLGTQAGRASATITAHILALRSFGKWLVANGLLKKNPTKAIPIPRRRRPMPRFLDESDIAKLREGLYTGTRGRLVHAAIDLLYASGMRIMELVALDIGDLDLEHGSAIIRRGKGGKGRMAFLGESVEAIKRWLDVRDDWADPSEKALFVSYRGSRIDIATIQQLIRNYGRRILGKRITPHMFRHSLGKHMLDHGADLRTIQEVMGHASLATTQIYTHASLAHLRETYEKCHPMGGKKGEKQ